MTDLTELETRLRAIEPGWTFAKGRTLARLARSRRDAGERIPPKLSEPLLVDGQLWVHSPLESALGEQPLARQLRHYWRMLYTLRLPETHAVAVWRDLPAVVRRETEELLKSEGFVSPDATEAELASAFADDLRTLARFDVGQLAFRYPGLLEWPVWRARLCVGFDEEAIYIGTRPEGAADPQSEMEAEFGVGPVRNLIRNDARTATAKAKQAEGARERGNYARAAILYSAAAHACSRGSTKYRTVSKEALRIGLVERLAPILNWNSSQQAEWKTALQALLPPAAQGHWSPPAKALYDLQKLAVDLEGDVYAVDPWGWATTLGRRPLLRKLSLSRVAMVHRQLRKVRKNLLHSKVSPAEQDLLLGLLDAEIARAEIDLRAAMEPILLRVLGEVGFVPNDPVERIALRKIVDELLDKTIEQGFLRLGDLRDTLARNQLKMPDLRSPGEFFRGDPLLQADCKLGDALDGVYYPGELYLRWFQRGSALAFGTPAGRWFSLFIAAPFGAAFMTVEFAKYIAHELRSIERFFVGLFESAAAAQTEVRQHKSHAISLTPESIAVMLVLGFFYLGLIHSRPLRRRALRVAGDLGNAVGWLSGTLPQAIWNSPPVRYLRRNRAVNWILTKFTIPVLGAGVVAISGEQSNLSETAYRWEIAGTFTVLVLLLNTPFGRAIQERVGLALVWLWRQIRTNFFPGLIGWIVQIFQWLLAGLDRLIYSIDEWLRYRAGQPKPSLWLKVALASVWFPVRYVLRFAIYLLIEPQINPIKHFPVVTVSHKLLLPMIPSIAGATGVGKEWVTAGMSGVPGIFGFLAWEVKENWRLYAANRPEQLKPLALGHHAETMRALLRPGFHSGTVPKAYAAIRREWARAEERRDAPDIQKPLDTLHGVELVTQHFAERELLAYLGSSEAWRAIPLRCEGITLGLQHIRIRIRGEGPTAELRFELIDSEIHGYAEDRAFLEASTPRQREVWAMAVLGFFAMGSVPAEDPRLRWAEWVQFWQACKG